MAMTVESLRKAVGKKKNSRAFAWLADLMRQNGDLDGALSCVQAGLSVTPCEEGNLVLSKILVEKQDWDGVIEACEFVLSRNPYCLSAIRRLGDAYAEKGDVEKRNLYYRLLHDLDPLDAFWKEEYAPKIETIEEMPALDDLPNPVPSLAAEPVLEPEPLEQEATVSEENKTEEEKDEDPFSSLATLLPADDENDNEVSFHDLENSLDKAIADFSPSDTAEKDEFPTEEIDGDDISTALSGIFGAAETEEPASEKQEEKTGEPSPVEKTEDKPQSLSDAFDSIFGEDELPEEFVLSKPSDETAPQEKKESLSGLEPSVSESTPLFEKSTEKSSKPESTLEKSVESSFDSLFGDASDDLPLEGLGELPKAAAESASHIVPSDETAPQEKKDSLSGLEPSVSEASPLFEKSAEASLKPESTLEKSVESPFDSLFGDASDDLPLEGLGELPKPAAESATHIVPSAEVAQPQEKEESSSAAAESSVSESSPLFEKSTEESSKPESTLEKSVESSFDSLFGDASDDLPLEGLGELPKSAAESASHIVPSDEAAPQEKKESLSGLEPSVSEASPLFEKSSEESSKPESTLEKSVESSFDSLFGDASDDLPLEGLGEQPKPAAESATHIVPSAEVAQPQEKEESLSGLEPSVSESSPLFEKSTEKSSKPESTLEKSVESSFDSLFGDASDDALSEDPTTSTRTLAEIYFEQGVYDEAIKIYRDLLRKNPDDATLKNRLSEIEKIRDDKKEN